MTSRLAALSLVSLLTVCLFSACANATARQYTALLAADTARLNDEFEKLTKIRQQIEGSRDRLASLLELSTLQTDSYVQRRLAEWLALKGDAAFKERTDIFTLVKAHTDAAVQRETAIEAVSRKVLEARIEAKGRRSEQLTETAKYLGALAQERALREELKFLSGYVHSVQDSLKAAQEDAKKAAAAADDKVAANTKSLTSK